VVAGPGRQGFTSPMLTKVSHKKTKVGSSWILLSNVRNEFLYRTIWAWLGQVRRLLTLQPPASFQDL
jgi:hypothetical protein